MNFYNFYSGGPIKPYCTQFIDNYNDIYDYPDNCKINQNWLNMNIVLQATTKI